MCVSSIFPQERNWRLFTTFHLFHIILEKNFIKLFNLQSLAVNFTFSINCILKYLAIITMKFEVPFVLTEVRGEGITKGISSQPQVSEFLKLYHFAKKSRR